MKIQATIAVLAMLAVFPLAANAHGFGGGFGGNLNINLNDEMVSQRMLDMSQRLNNGDAPKEVKAKKHHDKHHKNQKVDQATADDLKATNDVAPAAAAAAAPAVGADIH